MSRGAGFEVADTDSGMLSDPKVLALARRLHDSTRTGAAIALYDATRLASWRDGARLTLDETVPGWWLDPVDDLAAALVAVGLLDSERRIPVHAWEGWYGPARDRRQRLRDLGARGGRAKAEHGLLAPDPYRTVERTPKPTVERTVYPVPSVPSDTVRPSVGGDAAKDDDDRAAAAYAATVCSRCHGVGTEGNPLVTETTGRHHRFAPCPAAAPAVDWIASVSEGTP